MKYLLLIITFFYSSVHAGTDFYWTQMAEVSFAEWGGSTPPLSCEDYKNLIVKINHNEDEANRILSKILRKEDSNIFDRWKLKSLVKKLTDLKAISNEKLVSVTHLFNLKAEGDDYAEIEMAHKDHQSKISVEMDGLQWFGENSIIPSDIHTEFIDAHKAILIRYQQSQFDYCFGIDTFVMKHDIKGRHVIGLVGIVDRKILTEKVSIVFDD
jgi:hypothetical protein